MSQDQRSDPDDDGQATSGAATLSGGHILFCFFVSLLAAAIVGSVFSPRFYVWQDLHNPAVQFNPDINRAAVTLQQVEDPFLQDTELGLTNLGLQWRLFFPLLAHYLSLPEWLFLALPHVGCLLVLGLITYIVLRDTGSYWKASVAALLAGALPWFFVSTGWLSYFDSWWVLGLLAVSVIRSRIGLVSACLIVPWIDERFVIGLPLAVVVRAFYLYGTSSRDLKPWYRDILIVLALLLPYVMLRVVGVVGQDATAAHFSEEWKRIDQAEFEQFKLGLWSGFRAAWIFIFAFIVLAWRRRPRLLIGLALPGILLTTAAAIGIAADMSRGLMMLMPVMLAGLLLVLRTDHLYGSLLLCGAAAANLLLPAHHFMWYDQERIHSLAHELKQLEKPIAEHHARYAAIYTENGEQFRGLGQLEQALVKFEFAIGLAPDIPAAHVYRGMVHLQLSELDMARRDIERGIELDPTFAEGYFARGVLNLKIDDQEAAIRDLEKAIKVGGASWSRRKECRFLLDSLSARQ